MHFVSGFAYCAANESVGQCLRKAATWCCSLLREFGNSMLYDLTFTPVAPIWRFQNVLLSIWGCIHIYEKSYKNETPSSHLNSVWWCITAIHITTWLTRSDWGSGYLWSRGWLLEAPTFDNRTRRHATEVGEPSLNWQKISATRLLLTSGRLTLHIFICTQLKGFKYRKWLNISHEKYDS